MDAQPPMEAPGQEDGMEQPQDNNGDSMFDTGFDAGVEADEDEDPKKFIQQLTGKLSQSLSTYFNENGDDQELAKYVAKMIVKIAAKALDEKERKDVIKAINTTEEPDDAEVSDEVEQTPEIGMDDGLTPDAEPMMEARFTKKELLELKESAKTGKERKKSPFDGKKFNK